jgi:hypothetical protein
VNSDFLTAIQALVSSQGVKVLFDVRQADAALPVFAGKKPAEERSVFICCISSGVPSSLQKEKDPGSRLALKKQLAKIIIDQHGFAVPTVKEMCDLIEESLYGEVTSDCGLIKKYGMPYPRHRQRSTFPKKWVLAACCGIAFIALVCGIVICQTNREQPYIKTLTAKDPLAHILQDLAMQTACIGKYNIAEIGGAIVSRYANPPDWYTPDMLAKRFAAMSGNRTRIDTFYGVCFDYAQAAWDDIAAFQKYYNDAGMHDKQWYIAAANQGNTKTIILYVPVPEAQKEQASTVSNGVFLKEISRHKVRTHDNASGHAWLWVQHQDGTWYWIDPTWTDNTGYVWWGKVEDDREVMYYPDAQYCAAPAYPRAGDAP